MGRPCFPIWPTAAILNFEIQLVSLDICYMVLRNFYTKRDLCIMICSEKLLASLLQCHLTKAVMRGLFIGSIRSQAHVRQVTSIFSQSDVIMLYCISAFSGIFEGLF